MFGITLVCIKGSSAFGGEATQLDRKPGYLFMGGRFESFNARNPYFGSGLFKKRKLWTNYVRICVIQN